jgi:16S rRNA (cytosine967-C5)-methyltransferase
MAAVSPARKVAFAILKTIELGQSHSDDLLGGKYVAGLSPVDRNLATALVLGTLRWQIQIDGRVRALLKHPNAKLDPEVLIALRLGVFQLVHLDRVPAHAAIDESVELAKQAGHRFASGMVNAVLRKLAEAQPAAKEDSSPEPSIQAYPAWMIERWGHCYGSDVAGVICRYGQSQPPLTVRMQSPDVELELAAEGVELQPGEVLTLARTVISGDVTRAAAFREGRARIQDEGSQLVAELAPRGSLILDSCAAPGGKTIILAERNPHARIVACEASEPRLVQLRKRLAYFGSGVECRHADATALVDESAYDVVLADVPCSGTGTLGRNPEIRHRLRPEDLPRHAARQMKILRSALRAVKPGGCVIYSTCSLEPEENEQIVAALLAENAGARQVSLASRIEKLSAEGILTASGAERLKSCILPEGALRLLPGAFHTDGFFVALIDKRA